MSGAAVPADRLMLKGPELWLGGVVVAMAPFISVLDLTLVNIILPHIAGSFGATPREATLVVTFFAIAQAISMPLSGWLAGRFGAAKVFHASLIGFAAASFLCGAAPTLNLLIAARILQGAFAGPILPLSQSILQRTFPPKYAPVALTAWSVAMMAGPLLGPTLGGLLADSIGWQWGFFINVPLVAACTVLSFRLFAKRDTPTVRTPIDAVGLILMIVWVGALQTVLDYGHEKDWIASPFILSLSIVALVAFVGFLLWELTDRHPIVDLSVFRYLSFSMVAVITALTYGAATGGSLMVYIWLQTHLGYDATTAGIVSAMTGIPGILIGPVIAILSRRIDMRWLATAGLVISAISLFWRCSFTTEVNLAYVLIPQVLIGIAGPLYWGPMMAIGTSQVPQSKLSSAAGLLAFTRTVAFAAQIALITTFWEMGTRTQHAGISGGVKAHAPETLGLLQSLGLTAEQALNALNDMVDNQAALLALQQLFLVLGLVILLGVIFVWIAPKPKVGAAASGVAD